MLKDKMIERAGGLLMVGFQGTKPDDHLRRMIEEFRVGGIILFRRNVVNAEQVAGLTRKIQRIAKNAGYENPLIISTDQEGGIVNRIRDGVTLSPGNMAIGASGKKDIAREIGEVIGKELSSIGINMNLAPVLDLARSPSNHLGTRCFGEKPELVGTMGRELSGGLADYGVSPVGKHFLGYGSSKADPHLDLPRNNLSGEQLKNTLKPFEIARESLQGIMTAHIILSSIDSSPATLSAKVIKELLREKIGFTGPVITDCLEMDAIQDKYGTGEAAVKAVKSDADFLIVSHHEQEQISAIRSLRKALTDERLKEEEFEKSWNRVNRLKTTKTWEPSSSYSLEKDEEKMMELSGKTVTALSREGIPLKEGEDVLSINPKLSGRSLSPVQEKEYGLLSVKSRLEKAGVRVQEITYEQEVPNFGRLENQIENCDKVLVLALEANKKLNDLAKHFTRKETEIILVSLQKPWGFGKIPADSSLFTYGYPRPSLKGLANVLLGRIRPNSNPPITLENN